MPTPNEQRLKHLQRQIWDGTLPLEIRLAASNCRTYDESEPYLIQYPRLSYLAFLLPRLHAFFSQSLIEPDTSPKDSWLEFENVPLKWHYPLGVLYDVFSGAEPASLEQEIGGLMAAADATERLPWRLVVHYTDYPGDQLTQLDTEGRAMLDSFINNVKEADFIRNGTARTVMSLSKDDSDALWEAVKTHDLRKFNSINTKLLHPPGVTIRHVPLKVYLPSSAEPNTSVPPAIPEEGADADAPTPRAGHVRVVQSLVPLQTSSRQAQTIGTALNSMLPTIFPSRRNPLLAQPVLHGAVVPMGANLEELGRVGSYSDGFLHFGVVMMN